MYRVFYYYKIWKKKIFYRAPNVIFYFGCTNNIFEDVLPGVNVVVVVVDPLPPEGNSTDVGRVVIGLVVGRDVVGRVVGL